MRWETRYSPAEMAYLEIGPKAVVCYLNTPSAIEGRWTFAEVLAGEADYLLNILYGSEVLTELKAEVRRRTDKSTA